MGIGTGIANAAASLLGGVGEQIGFGLGELTGYNKKIAERQVKQQQKLTDQQVAAQKELAQNAKELEYQQWLDTNYSAQVEQLKKAGLNPALVYGSAGEGGTTGAGGQGAATGGHASDEASRKLANIQNAELGLRLGRQKAEIENIKADTMQKKAEAKTTEGSRDILIEKLKQEGQEK